MSIDIQAQIDALNADATPSVNDLTDALEAIQAGANAPSAVVTTFYTSGTFNINAGATAVEITVYGGGGSGAKNTASSGLGGGGGGYAWGVFNASDIEASEPIVVGAGGASVAVNGDGNAGGLSSFGDLGAVVLTAAGGTGGNGSSVGGVGSGGDINASLGDGHLPDTFSARGGNGGGWGGGIGNKTNGGAGGAARSIGGAGGGCKDGASGAGGQGAVIIKEYY